MYEGRDLEDANGDIEGEEVKFDKGSFKEADDGRWEEERPRGGGWKEVEVEVGEEETVDDKEGDGNEDEWINGEGKAKDWREDK